MMVETANMMPITKLQKTLTQTVRKLSENKNPVFILKNNAMEAVLMSFERYEYLSQLEELVEHQEIFATVNARMKNYDPSKSISLDDLD